MIAGDSALSYFRVRSAVLTCPVVRFRHFGSVEWMFLTGSSSGGSTHSTSYSWSQAILPLLNQKKIKKNRSSKMAFKVFLGGKGESSPGAESHLAGRVLWRGPGPPVAPLLFCMVFIAMGGTAVEIFSCAKQGGAASRQSENHGESPGVLLLGLPVFIQFLVRSSEYLRPGPSATNSGVQWCFSQTLLPVALLEMWSTLSGDHYASRDFGNGSASGSAAGSFTAAALWWIVSRVLRVGVFESRMGWCVCVHALCACVLLNM